MGIDRISIASSGNWRFDTVYLGMVFWDLARSQVYRFSGQ
jgi:hypothetical protein